MQVFSVLIQQMNDPAIAERVLRSKEGYRARRAGFTATERNIRRRYRDQYGLPLENQKRFTKKHMDDFRLIEKGLAEGKSYRQISKDLGKSIEWASNFMVGRRRKLEQGYT